jgi:hypothetical protein
VGQGINSTGVQGSHKGDGNVLKLIYSDGCVVQ